MSNFCRDKRERCEDSDLDSIDSDIAAEADAAEVELRLEPIEPGRNGADEPADVPGFVELAGRSI